MIQSLSFNKIINNYTKYLSKLIIIKLLMKNKYYNNRFNNNNYKIFNNIKNSNKEF